MFEKNEYTEEINSYFAERNKEIFIKKGEGTKFTPDQFKFELKKIFTEKINNFSSEYKNFFEEKYKKFFEQEKEIYTTKYGTYLTVLFHPDKSTVEAEKVKIKILLEEAKKFFKSEDDKKKLKKNNTQINSEEIMLIYKNLFFISLFFSWNIIKPFFNNKIDLYLQKTKYNTQKTTFF